MRAKPLAKRIGHRKDREYVYLIGFDWQSKTKNLRHKLVYIENLTKATGKART